MAAPEWLGWEFWWVTMYGRYNPREVATTWSLDEIHAAYFALRLKELKDPPGGAV